MKFLCLKINSGNTCRNLWVQKSLLVVLHILLKSRLSLHINHSVKGSLPYLHCACTKKSNSVPEKKWGDCNCCSQKSFLFHSSGEAECWRISAVLLWEKSPSATAFSGRSPSGLDPERWGEEGVPLLPRMQSVFPDLCVIFQAPFLAPYFQKN